MRENLHWTISRLKTFEQCPAKYRYEYLLEPLDWLALGYEIGPVTASPAMQRGTDIHQTCENFLNGTGPLHSEIGPAWAVQLNGLRFLDAHAEEQWEFEDGWHPKEDGALWLRMRIDAYYQPSKEVLHVIDFKTGKPYAANIEQVEVYALGAFAKFDDVRMVVGELWYLDHEEPHEKVYTRAQAEKLARKWDQRAERLIAAVQYPPRKNRFCDWCAYHVKKGGPCTPPA